MQDCHSVLQLIPRGLEIGQPLVGTHPDSPYYLPQEFIVNNCRISFELAPGLTQAKIFWATLKFRAAVVVNLRVGGQGAWGLGLNQPSLVPGRGGNYTYGGVKIRVDQDVIPTMYSYRFELVE